MRAEVCGEEIKLFDCYRVKETIKEIAGRYFDADERCWHVPNTEGNVALLQLLGFDVNGAALKATKPEQRSDAKPQVNMPIKAKPYAHQVDAFNFALNIFSEGGDENNAPKE